MDEYFLKWSWILLIITVTTIVGCAGKSTTNDTDPDDTGTSTVAYQSNDSFPPGKITTVVCLNDASKSYALYIPVNGMNENSSVVFFFDPHADGSLPVKKYQALADKYNFIFIGSNNSKNGNDWQTSENICASLLTDVKSRLLFDAKRTYACGFSGGAKVAGYFALNHPEIKAVIANGAGLPDQTRAGNFSFTFTAIAGEGDMNMTDLIAVTADLDKTETKHRIIFFRGKHEWAPETTMSIAFEGLQLDAMRDNIIPKDEAFINNYISDSKQNVDAFLKAKNFIAAERECRLSQNLLAGLTRDVNWFTEKDAAIASTPAFQSQLARNEGLLNIEENKKAEFNQQFQQGDMNYWTKTIADLQARSKAQTDEGAMYQRLLAYLSLAFYSITNQLINTNENKGAQYFVELYKKTDPTNSEAWYFSAILDARSNNAVSTQSDLLKAVENGFNDKERMMQQPDFINLSGQINLAIIESKMKNGN